MTRINCVPTSDLHDRILVAEYHELPRVFVLVRRAMARGRTPDSYRKEVKKYTMGPGHVKFFYPRLKYLAERLIEVIAEMTLRKMRPREVNFEELFAGIPEHWFGDWVPAPRDLARDKVYLKARVLELKKTTRMVVTPYNEHLLELQRPKAE